jgi:hypothetical protein
MLSVQPLTNNAASMIALILIFINNQRMRMLTDLMISGLLLGISGLGAKSNSTPKVSAETSTAETPQ